MIAWTTARRATASAAGGVLALALTAGPSAASADGVVFSDGGSGPASGAVLSLSGAPLVHTFDTTTPGDRVEGEWTLASSGAQAVSYDGVLAPVGEFSLDLAQNLDVEYGVVGSDGSITGWAQAGTLAQPVSYTTALGAHSPEIAGEGEITIPVRVTLSDPDALTSEPGEPQTVGATFSINYLSSGGDGEDGAGDGGPGGGGPGGGESGAGADGDGAGTEAAADDSGILASTGAQIFGWILLALAAVTVGSRLRRRRTAD